ncbi:nitrate ABC transporter permease [Cellulomonas composti]|uniref:Nitrate ABC transporter permease n=1 Tax=Cellulomonas composti TaxID=266130 RepID=A0A511J7I8_9CELL|nr:nitrate ABC transporter permease [Cellulomonas composti]
MLVVAFWLVVWQVAAVLVGQRILLPSPVEVLTRLGELVVTPEFWTTVATSMVRIVAGLLLGTALGTLTAALAARSRTVDALVTPLLGAVRAAPVVSFIILVLIWVDTVRLSVVVSTLMVLPVVHTAVLTGLRHRDVALLEMTTVFGVPWQRRLAAVDVPAVLPFFAAACRVGVGLAWKSGIAAEVIGLPAGTIGERLYDAKLLLESADVFAWTLVVIALSLTLERLVAALLAHPTAAQSAPGGAS